MSKKLTTKEFIQRAKEIHGDKYDYSKVKYVNNKTKVCIICPIHGKFEQTPCDHLAGYACRKCAIEKNSILQKKWNKDKVFKESKKYNCRTDFKISSSRAYIIANENNWLDEMTWLKPKINIHKDGAYIYAYIDEENKYVYVGLTLLPKDRDSQHRNGNGKSSVYKYFKSINKEIPQPIYLEKGLSQIKAQEQEHYWCEYYKSIGYTLINKAKTGKGCSSLGGCILKWNYNSCIKESKKYEYLKDFIKYSSGAAASAKRNGWLKEMYWLKRIKLFKGYWNKENTIRESKKYEYLKDFIKYSSGAAASAKRNGWLNELYWLKRKHEKSKGYYNDYNLCKDLASKCIGRKNFERTYSSAYKYSVKNGWLDEFFPINK